MKRCTEIALPAALALALVLSGSPLEGYSVLSHEAIVDSLWGPVIRPLLLERYPTASAAQLQEAHAYVYGGCVIQDMGYYPFGSRFFSDLTHYVRSGDFIVALIDDAGDMYQYAFALGALAHYAADNQGHPLAVNRSVPDIYPRLRRKFGQVVTFEDDPKAHVMVEFSFDVAQIAGAGYLPKTYQNFIGFKVSKPLLNQAFKETYGVDVRDLFLNEDLAIGTYRRGASEIIPRMTQIAWRKRRKEIQKTLPGITRSKFIYHLSRANYQRQYGSDYQNTRFFFARWREQDAKMSLVAKVLVFLFQILPKWGRLQTLEFKSPTPQTQALFIKSFGVTVAQYRGLLDEVKANRLTLDNRDFDTGRPTQAGAYGLADRAYARLLEKLDKENFKNVTPELRANILNYYGDLSAPVGTKQDPEQWQKTLKELNALKAGPTQRASTGAKSNFQGQPPAVVTRADY